MKKDDLIHLIKKHPNFAGHGHDPRQVNKHLHTLKRNELHQVLFNLDSGVSGGGLFDSLKKFASNALSKGNTLIHNIYRANNCNGRARPLESGEYHYGCHNYTGPGTRIDLYPDYPPYNNIDRCSQSHDLAYQAIRKKLDSGAINDEQAATMVHQADSDAIACYNQYPNEDGYQQAMLGLSGKFLSEKLASKLRGRDSVIYS
jgi:hypothetical protein